MTEEKAISAKRELAFQIEETQKRTAELIVANKELFYQNLEKEKRAAELIIANKELAYQNEEKEKLAAELLIANKELIYQNIEKEKRAAELVLANKELFYQNIVKEKLAAELIIANKELAYQNKEKEKRAAELIRANEKLVHLNTEKEKQTAELIIANKELESFTFISSHDLQEPLRKIRLFASRILDNEYLNLSDNGQDHFKRMQRSALHMQTLINDLLAYSRTSTAEKKFEYQDLNQIVEEVKLVFKEEIRFKNATVESNELCATNVIALQFRQLLKNIIGNALKFSKPDLAPHIVITGTYLKNNQPDIIKNSSEQAYYHVSISDNGIGFDPQFKERIFGIFQRLNEKKEYEGTGMGLTIVKKIVENHGGVITASSELDKGTTFDIYIPVHENITHIA